MCEIACEALREINKCSFCSLSRALWCWLTLRCSVVTFISSLQEGCSLSYMMVSAPLQYSESLPSGLRTERKNTNLTHIKYTLYEKSHGAFFKQYVTLKIHLAVNVLTTRPSRCRLVCFFIWTDFKKCCFTVLAHQWFLCSEWVPSELNLNGW